MHNHVSGHRTRLEERARRGVSRREVLSYALAAPALAGLGTLAAAVRGPKASAANAKLIDFAERLVAADQVAAAGYAGALVYVSELRPGATFDFKPVTREYADALRAAGLHVVSCYQYGKPGWPTPSDFTRGYDGGVADAQTALRLHGCRRRAGFGADLLQHRRGHRRQYLEKRCGPVASRNQLGAGR